VDGSTFSITGDPTQDDQAYISQLESDTNNLLGAAGQYGYVPDPQMATQAGQIGAVPALTSSFGQNSEINKMLAARPVGISTAYSPSSVDLGQVQSLSQTGARFDAKSFLADQKQAIQKNTNGAGQWDSLGEIPVANQDYVRDLVASTDQSRIKSYQSFLLSRGLGVDNNGKKMAITGQWNPDWLINLRSFFVARMLPEALWGRNTQTKSQAQQFLQDSGVDVSTLNRLGNNDKAKIIDNYVHTAGDGAKPKDTLEDLENKYGAGVLDQAHHDMLHPGFMGQLGGFIHAAASILPSVGGAILGQMLIPIPILGAVIGGAVTGLVSNLALGELSKVDNPITNLISTGTPGLSQDDLKGYDDEEKKVLQDMNKGVAQSSGLFGLLDAYQRKLNQTVIAGRYFIGDALGGKSVNVFDEWQSAGKFADDPMRGLLGDNFVTENPILNFIGNTAIGMVDDPTVYLGGLGLDAHLDEAALKAEGELAAKEGRAVNVDAAIRLGRPVANVNAARKYLLGRVTRREAIAKNGVGQYLLDLALRPNARAQSEMVRHILSGDTESWEVAQMFGDFRPETLRSLHQAKQSGDIGQVIDHLNAYHRGQIGDPSRYAVMSNAHKIFDKGQFNKLGEAKQATIMDARVRGRQYFRNFIDTEDPNTAMDKLHMAMQTYGFNKADTNEVMTMLMEGRNNMEIEDKVNRLADKYLKEENPKIDEDIKDINGRISFSIRGKTYSYTPGKKVRGSDQRRMYLPTEDKDGNIVEASVIASRYKFDNPGSQARADEVRGQIEGAKNMIDGVEQHWVDQLMQDGGMSEQQARDHLNAGGESEYSESIQEVQQKVADLVDSLEHIPGRSGVEGDVPVAAFSGQFKQGIQLKYSPYDVLVSRSPKLKKLEQFQRAAHVDNFNDMWKRSVLFRLGTSIKVDMGDDVMRIFMSHFHESPLKAMQYLGHSWTKIRGNQYRPLPNELKSDINRLMTLYKDDYITFHPDDQGYAQALHHMMTNIVAQSPEAGVWAKAMKAGPQRRKYRTKSGQIRERSQSNEDYAVQKLMEWMQGPGHGLATGHPATVLKHAQGELRKATEAGDQAEIDRWAKDVEDWTKQSEKFAPSPEAQEFARREGVDITDKDQVAAWARFMHKKLMTVTKYDGTTTDGQFLLNAVHDIAHGEPGKYTAKEFADWAQRNSGKPQYLPLVTGRRPYAMGSGLVDRNFKRVTDGWHQKVTGSLINSSRRKAYDFEVEQQKAVLQKLYSREDVPPGKDYDTFIEEMASTRASDMIRRTTYQFQRSIISHASRNIAPFSGATSSMDRFWFNQAIANPFWAKGELLAMDKLESLRQQNKLNVNVPFTGWAMQRLGMSNADNISFDPTRAFYFADYAGFLPSMGPVLEVPLRTLGFMDPDIQNALQSLPGNSGLGGGTFLPFLGNFATGLDMATGENGMLHPVLGGVSQLLGVNQVAIKRQEVEVAQEQEAAYLQGKGAKPTDQSVAKQVGEGLMVKGALQWATPTGGTVNQTGQYYHIQDVQTQMDNATTDQQRQQILRQNKDVAPLLVYRDSKLAPLLDPKLSQLSRSELDDYLLGSNSWIAAYGKTTKETDLSLVETQEPSKAALQTDVQTGVRDYLSPDEIATNAMKQIHVTDGWIRYNAANDAYKQALVQYGVSSSSTHALILQPVLDNLKEHNDDWQAAYSSMGSAAGAAQKNSERISSLATWNVLPFNTSNETQSTQSWRQLLAWKENLMGQLNEMKTMGVATSTQQQLVNQFNVMVEGLANQDPVFGKQISQYSYKQLDDFLEN